MTAPEPARPSDWRVENIVVACDRDSFGEVVYRLAVRHEYPVPADLAIGCIPPAGATGVSASLTPKSFRDGVVWEFSAVPAGEAIALLVRFPGAAANPQRFRVATRKAAVPVLSVRLEIPSVVSLDTEFDAAVTVANTGVTARAVGVLVGIPEEILYRSATAGGLLAETGDAAMWTIPTLEAGTEWTGVVRLVGFAPGPIQLTATASLSGVTSAATSDLVCEVPVTAKALAGLLAGLVSEAEDLSGGHFDDESGVPHLVFRLGGNRFALTLGEVSEVLRPAGLTQVPGMPSWLAGVANVRGDLVPVLGLSELLGVSAGSLARALIVVRRAEDDAVGFLADDIVGIRSLATGVELPEDLTEDSRSRFVLGLATAPDESRAGGGLIQRLDLDRVLSAVDAGLVQTA